MARDPQGPARAAHPTVSTWLEHFTQAVRTNDIDAGRGLFAADAIGYGTRERRAVGLDHLVDEQWQPTWRRIRSWTVHEIDVMESDDALAAIAFTWTRENDDADPVSGRATLVLRDHGAGWQCVHSHFSADPRATPEGYW